MTGIVGLVGAADQLHNRCPVGIIVVAICKVLSLRRMKQVFTSFVIPLFENRIGSVMYWNRSNATVRLAFYNFKVMFIYENILTLQVKKFRNSYSTVEQHQHNLNVNIICLHPKSIDFFFCKWSMISFIWIFILEFQNIHIL